MNMYKMILIIALLFANCIDVLGQDSHLDIKNAAAKEYLNGEAQLRLAKYHYDQGNLEMAFSICEYARGLIGDESFEAANANILNAKLKASGVEFKSEEEFQKYVCANPKSIYAQLALVAKARAPGDVLEQLLKKYPDSLEVVAALAKYNLKVAKKPDEALRQYLEVYFVFPHYYDGEYAEFRINELLRETRKQRWEHDKRDVSVKLFDDRIPSAAGYGIEELGKMYNNDVKGLMVRMLATDDMRNQSRALNVLMAHKYDIRDAELEALLVHPDYAVQAMALILSAGRLSNSNIIRALSSDVQIIQIDAMGAASTLGAPGVALLKEHKPSNMHPRVLEAFNYFTREQNSNGDGLKTAP